MHQVCSEDKSDPPAGGHGDALNRRRVDGHERGHREDDAGVAAPAQRVGALTQVPRLHVRLDHAGRELALGRLRHLQLQARAVAVAVVAALPLHARRRKLAFDEIDGDVARVGAVRVSAAAERDLEGEGHHGASSLVE